MDTTSFQSARAWLFDHAFPYWAERGVDSKYGGFYEELGRDGAPTSCSFKRVRVACRQTYVFSHAALLGWDKAEPLSQLGFDYLRQHAFLGAGRWASVLSRDGRILDAASDLYDLAFVIFALAWRYRASGDVEALMLARMTIRYIKADHVALGGGYHERRPGGGARLQNPHMHLLESCLAAYEAFQEEEFLDVAMELVALLQNHLFDGQSVGEAFETDWARASNALEPGHQFEWVWILAQYQRLSGERIGHLADVLYTFADRYGVSSQGFVYDTINADGSILRASSRIWPNTERLKAALGRFELSGANTSAVVRQCFDCIKSKYFADLPPGLFIDRIDAEGSPVDAPVPASCLYHVVLAFAECMRIGEAIGARGARAMKDRLQPYI